MIDNRVKTCKVCKVERKVTDFVGKKPWCKLCHHLSTKSEHELQSEFFELLAKYPSIRKKVISIPNGGLRNIKVAKDLKKEGARAGAWDIVGFIPTKNYHGFFIEFKTVKGNLSQKQEEFRDDLGDEYSYAVFVNPKSALQWVLSYCKA